MPENGRLTSRREFIRGSGALGAGAVLLNPFAQTQNSDGHRVYKSGETIDDRVSRFNIDGWTVTYNYQDRFDYLGKSHRTSEILLRGQLVTQGSFFDQFQKDGKTFVRMVALPAEADDRAYLHVIEREGEDIGRDRTGRIVAERVYPIALDFHTFGNFHERTPGLSTPTARSIGVLSEIPIDQSVLGQVFEVYRSFGALGWGSPPIYIHRFADTLDENARDAHLWPDRAIQIHAEAITHPNDHQGLEGVSRVFMRVAEHLGREESFYGRPDSLLKTKLKEAHESFLQSIGYREEEYTGLNSKLDGQAWVDNRRRIVESQQSQALDLDSYVLGRWEAADYSVSSRDIYYRSDILFGSALAVFRFFPEQFLERFKKMKPQEQKVVARVGTAVLDYLASYAKPEELRTQLDVVRAVPAYHILKNEFARHA